MTSEYWCGVCSKDLQSEAALAGHVTGRRHLYRLGSRPASRLLEVLQAPLSEEQLFARLARGDFKNVIVCTGAGVSTAAGIPDFRSAGGMFELIRATWSDRFPQVLASPEDLLSRHFAMTYPKEWAGEVEPWLRSLKWCSAMPTETHWFCSWLQRQGWLQRVYTQNVDGLHLHPDLSMPAHSVFECHGALRDGSIVLYGDALPSAFDSVCKADFPTVPREPSVDLVIVFGTSLQVAPFCALPNMAPRGCTRVLVNRELSACMVNAWSRRIPSGGYYNSYENFAPATAHIGDWKNVSLRPLWQDRKASQRWPQLLVESDSDDFVERFFASPEASEIGLALRSS